VHARKYSKHKQLQHGLNIVANAKQRISVYCTITRHAALFQPQPTNSVGFHKLFLRNQQRSTGGILVRKQQATNNFRERTE
jgi:hypothetical protein